MYLQQALKSLKLEKTNLLEMYFGEQNMLSIQLYLNKYIYDTLGVRMARQSDSDLYVIMQYMYVNFAHRISGPDKLNELNKLVIKEVLPMIKQGIEQRQNYIRDTTMQPRLMDRGISTTIRGENPVYMKAF